MKAFSTTSVFIITVSLVLGLNLSTQAEEGRGINASARLVRIGPRNPVKPKEINEEDIVVTTKKTKGRVSIIRSGYISIVDKVDKKRGSSFAVDFKIDEDEIKLSRISSLDEIKVGDIVEIECEERRVEYERDNMDGTKENAVKLLGRKVKKIMFVSSGDSRLSSDF